MKRTKYRSLLIVVLVLFANFTIAQESDSVLLSGANEFTNASEIQPNEFGISDSSYIFIPASAFTPSDSTTGYSKPFLFLTRTGGGGGEFTHPLILPRGAILENLRLYFLDNNPTLDVALRFCWLFTVPGTGAGQDIDCLEPGATSAGITGNGALVKTINVNPDDLSPGFEVFPIAIINLGAADSTQRLMGVRVQYRRQVSPAPATATFPNDVPTTHPFFRFIEALAASGVTSGCAPGSYCPNSPITRGEMAVFLSAALGLHWAP